MAQAIGKDKTTQVTKGKNDRVEDCVDGNMPHVQRSFDGHDVHKSRRGICVLQAACQFLAAF